MNSRIFYRGPSLLDHQPIIGVITGLTTPSTNSKTGDMLQTYILREDISPPAAINSGEDRSICGDCSLRGDGSGLGRACYVQVKWAPLAVWKFVQPQLTRGSDWRDASVDDEVVRTSTIDRFIRLGTYGDPAAIPLWRWELLLQLAKGWTGYTHQWRDPQFQHLRTICMASCDSPADYSAAVARGWRTFRVRGSIAEAAMTKEITCPASAEAGHKTTCQACGLCNGWRGIETRRNIVIVAHGSRTAKYGTQVLPFEEDQPWP